MIEIQGGWIVGTLPDDTGREWPIVHHQQSSRGPTVPDPDLCLHTTETAGYVETLEFPSQWQVGEGKIGQHIALGMQGDAVLEHDAEVVGIEMVGRSELRTWLPQESTLGPCIALVAWLHKTGRIRTGLKRPAGWPIVLDRMPAAVASYYRRHDGTWRKPGIYGHVEIPGNSHYDPGSFDYPTFIARVQAVLDDKGDEDVRLDKMIDAQQKFRKRAKELGKDPGPPPDGMADPDAIEAWVHARFLYNHPKV